MIYDGGSFDNECARLGPYHQVAVIGGGSWGSALAIVAARAGRQVTVWCRRNEVAEDININRRNSVYLGETAMPEGLSATTDLSDAVSEAGIILLVTPSGTVREISRQIARYARTDAGLVLCAKGVEVGSGKLLSDVATEELGGRQIGVLSGPTFALETARGNPTAVTVASEFDTAHPPETSLAARLALTMGTETFRPYVSDDVIGVEVGGAMKNVIAIACGMMLGAGFGENMRSALIARGLDEMKALAEVLGGRRETVTGLSGIGDLTLTCSSRVSRNMSFGVQLGEGTPREACFEGKPTVVEGEINARSVTDLARQKGVELPICETVRAILNDGAAISEAFARLWAAPLEAEPRAMNLELQHPAGEDAVQRLVELIE